MSPSRTARSIIVLALMLAGCGAPAAATPMPSASAGGSPAPSGFTALKDGGLTPGNYASMNFVDPFTFTVPADPNGGKWSVFDTKKHSGLFLANGAGEGVFFIVPTQAFLTDGSVQALPADWAAWLKANKDLAVTDAGSATVDGIASQKLEVTAPGAPANLLCGPSNGIRLASTEEYVSPLEGAVCQGDPKVVYVVPRNGKQLLVMVDKGIASKAQPLLDSVAFIQ